MEEKHILRLMFCFAGLVVFGNVTQGELFLGACVQNRNLTDQIYSYSDETSWVKIHTSDRLPIPSFNVVYYDLTRRGIENESVLVTTSDDSVFSLFLNDYGITSLLPISGLGTKYIVSACLPPSDYCTVLVIATHSQKTDVSITFRLEGNVTYDNNTYSDGDELKVSLEEYQTITIRSDFDLTGTVVNTIQTVALFTVVVHNSVNVVVSYEQLLPVHLYGQEHIVAVPPVYESFDVYQLQIISEHSDTQIVFNNGSVFSVDENRLYRQYLTPDTNIQFSSSGPVMTLLCRVNSIYGRYNEFVVVPPLTLYTKHAVISTHDTFKVLTESNVTDLVVQSISVSDIPGQWDDIPGTNYRVGTWRRHDILSVSSNSSFAVLVSDSNSMYNGGYGVFSSQSNTGNLSVARE